MLEQRITEDMKTAMKEKDAVRLAAIRAIKSAILLLKTEKGKASEVSDADTNALLQKLMKQRKEAFEVYQQQNRPDLAAEEQAQMEVISGYLPPQATDEDILKVIHAVLAEFPAASPNDFGKIMGKVNPQFTGKADSGRIAQLIKQALA
ncbi:MAG: GatB/YqeY domain-containing protein [Bacteroidetes bacterium]|nr:GatB/YqeY domain-containing protein [Bacteroidota bacterium]